MKDNTLFLKESQVKILKCRKSERDASNLKLNYR